MNTPQFDFLITYIEALLVESGLDDLNEQQKSIYVPQILARLEERIGLEMLPKLNDVQLAKFGKMAEQENTSSEQWKKFWYESIPTFEDDLKKVLVSFTVRVKEILSKTA